MMVDQKNKIWTHPNYKIVMLLIPFFPERNEIQRFSRTWISPACQATPTPIPVLWQIKGTVWNLRPLPSQQLAPRKYKI